MVWSTFFPEFLKSLDLQINRIFLDFLQKFREISLVKKDEFSRFPEKNLVFFIKEAAEKIIANFEKILRKFEEILSQSEENSLFFQGTHLQEDFSSVFGLRVKEQLREIQGFLDEKLVFFEYYGENSSFSLIKEGILQIKMKIFALGLFRNLREKATIFPEFLRDFLQKEFYSEISVLEAKIQNNFAEILNSEENPDDKNLEKAVFPAKIDWILMKINRFINEIECERKNIVFSNDFYCEISKKILENLTKSFEKCGDFEREFLSSAMQFLKENFFFHEFLSFTSENLGFSSEKALIRYMNFLKKDKKELFYRNFGVFPYKTPLKTEENTRFLDSQMNSQLINLLVLPHFFKEKTLKSSVSLQKTMKSNQIFQSQSLVSSVMNKDFENKEDYISRMMEGVIF